MNFKLLGLGVSCVRMNILRCWIWTIGERWGLSNDSWVGLFKCVRWRFVTRVDMVRSLWDLCPTCILFAYLKNNEQPFFVAIISINLKRNYYQTMQVMKGIMYCTALHCSIALGYSTTVSKYVKLPNETLYLVELKYLLTELLPWRQYKKQGHSWLHFKEFDYLSVKNVFSLFSLLL